MAVNDSDWREERQRLDLVLSQIRERLAKLRAEFRDVQADVMHARRHFWDDITIKADIMDTILDVNQQAMALSEGERRYHQGIRTIRDLGRLESFPYFGRVDFVEEGLKGAERIYLGVASLRSSIDQDFLVYDWRAPIASLYYDHGPGPADYTAPMGEIRGELLLKRQYVIADGQIRLMFDTGVTIGDDLLMQALGRHSSAEMRSIVATIQTEQNRIIRDDTSRLLIVQGVAGSGKTSAALQRVAYLLYRHRDTLQADQMVLFSPNPLFNSYVSTVLPELGEQNMQQTTFQEYIDHRLGRRFRVEDPFDQLEYVLTAAGSAGYAARLSGIRYKSSSAYLKVIARYARLLEETGVAFRPLRFSGREIVSVEAMAERFHSFGSGARLATRVSLLRDWLRDEVGSFAQRAVQEDWVDEEINFLGADAYAQADVELRRRESSGRDFDHLAAEREMLGNKVVRGRLKSLRTWIQRMQFVDVAELYAGLFRDPHLLARLSDDGSPPEFWPEICRETVAKLGRSILAQEDATPYLYLMELVRGSYVNMNVRHVIVDEAQDYTPFQFEFLKRLFPQSRMTVLGDLNQAVFAHSSTLEDLEDLRTLYAADETEVIRLMRSYRPTREIVEFTRSLLPHGEQIVPFDRPGERPWLMTVQDRSALVTQIAQDIAALRADGHDTIAVICKTAAESGRAHEALRRHMPVELITKRTATFAKGTLVIPAYLAKGVEFDAVLIYDASETNYRGDAERKLLYTACTRAMHRLHIFSCGAPSPLLRAADPGTYAEAVPGAG